MVAGRIAQVFQGERSIKLAQFAQGAILDVTRKPTALTALPDPLGLLVAKRADHRLTSDTRDVSSITSHINPALAAFVEQKWRGVRRVRMGSRAPEAASTRAACC